MCSCLTAQRPASSHCGLHVLFWQTVSKEKEGFYGSNGRRWVRKDEGGGGGGGGWGLSDKHQSDLPYSLRCFTPNGLPSQGCWRLSAQITILISSDSRSRGYLLAIDKGHEDLAQSKYMLCNWYTLSSSWIHIDTYVHSLRGVCYRVTKGDVL